MKKTLSIISLLIALCMVTACALEAGPKDLPEPIEPQVSQNKIEYFADEAEFLSFVEEHFVDRYYYYDGIINADDIAIAVPEDSAPTAPGAPTTGEAPKNETVERPTTDGAESDDHSETNVQVDGVDEGDILKTDGKYIYVIQGDEFIIVDIMGEVPQTVSSISLKKNPADDLYIREMYIKGDQAIFLCAESVRSEDTDIEIPKISESTGIYAPDSYYKYYTYTSYTSVLVYDISDRHNPTETRKISFEGYLVSSREMNGKIYLVNNKTFYSWSDVPVVDDILPEVIDSEYGICTPSPTDVAKCIWPEPQSNIMTIAIIDYTSDSQLETLHMMGCGSNIYMNSQNLYIFGNRYDNDGSHTEIAKYSITNGIVPVGTASAPGYAATQFSYDEYNGKFRIATTTNVFNGEKYINMNNIYVYDENMYPCGSLTGLAPDESIKSARFMGDTAYMVTFRQVDPLFVIDMSKNDPKVLGELKIPGFSTYLHPVGDGLLLGIGSETIDTDYGDWISSSVSGLKVSLFDVSDPTNPLEVDVASYVGGKNAYSEAKDNHNAFMFSSSTNTGYFPLTVYDDYWNSTNTLAEVKIENNRLEVNVADLEKIYKINYYYSESRVCYSGDYVYLFRNCAITKLDRETLEFVCETELPTLRK